MCIDRVGTLLYYCTRLYYNYVHCTHTVNMLYGKRLVSTCLCTHSKHVHMPNNLCRAFGSGLP